MAQNKSHAVMAQRAEPHDSLDFFPTPPWATRALCEWLRDTAREEFGSCIEPACGQGHMARPLKEFFNVVYPSDVHDYGYGPVEDFLFFPPERRADWVITNPPFRLAQQFIEKAIQTATIGVAMLCRSVFLESAERYRSIFESNAPTDVLIFSERVPMLKGRLERSASSATSYAWFVWRKHAPFGCHLGWIPPGSRKRLEKDSDYIS